MEVQYKKEVSETSEKKLEGSKLGKQAIENKKDCQVSNTDKSIARVAENRVPESAADYRRPYLRKEVVDEIYKRAPKDREGRYLDANTGKPIEGKPDIGHKAGHEFRREAQKAYNEGLTQQEFNERMNNADYYQLEDRSNNRSHKYEDKS